MTSSAQKSRLGLVMLLIALGGCAVRPVGITFSQEIADGAIMIVIDDPRGMLRRQGAGPGYGLPIAYAEDPILARYARSIADDYGLTILEQWPLRNLGVHCFVVEKPTPEVLANVNNDARVRWSQPFNEFQLKSGPAGAHLDAEDCVLCRFNAEFGNLGRDVTIAVIDTAVDTGHPDLQRSSLTTQNFAGRRGNPAEEKHGTAVVGLIAAVANTDKGLTGAAPEANVHLLRGCWQDSDGNGRCNTLTLALALDAAIDLHPDVLNLSLTGSSDRVLDELLTILLAKGTLVIAAHDDERNPDMRFPAQHDGVIYAYGFDGVSDDTRISNVFYAPRHALSLTPMAGYDLVSGHSIAAPQLAAMTARLIEHHATANRAEIIRALSDWLTDDFATSDARQ